jgi:hypothetical protein
MAKGELPRAIAERIAAEDRQQPEDRLTKIREKAKELRDLLDEQEELQAQSEQNASDIVKVRAKELPDLFEEASLNSIDVKAEGNHPGFVARLKPFYRASIPVDMETAKREAAFEHLIERGGGDLIKTTVSFDFPKDSEAEVSNFLQFVREQGEALEEGWPSPTVRMTVNHSSLSSWLKEEIESSTRLGKPLPDLSRLNAMVGKIVEIKEEKA